MFTPLARLLLVSAAVALGGREIASGRPWGWALMTGAALLALGYFRYGTIWLAFRAYRRGDLERLARRIRQVRDALLPPAAVS
jgi:hypothetical protein